MTKKEMAEEAMAHVACVTPHETGSLVYRTLARARLEIEARFGEDADFYRFLRELDHATSEASALLNDLENAEDQSY